MRTKLNYIIRYSRSSSKSKNLRVGHVQSGYKELTRFQVRFVDFGAIIRFYDNQGAVERHGYVIKKPVNLIDNKVILESGNYTLVPSITDLIEWRLSV